MKKKEFLEEISFDIKCIVVLLSALLGTGLFMAVFK